MQQLNKQILQKSGPAAHCENIRQIRDAVKFVVEVKQTNTASFLHDFLNSLEEEKRRGWQ